MVKVAKQFVSRPEDSSAVHAGTPVGGRQVQVAGDGVAELPEQYFTQHLRHDVSQLVLRGDWDDFDRPVLGVFTQEVVADVDVLGPIRLLHAE